MKISCVIYFRNENSLLHIWHLQSILKDPHNVVTSLKLTKLRTLTTQVSQLLFYKPSAGNTIRRESCAVLFRKKTIWMFVNS